MPLITQDAARNLAQRSFLFCASNVKISPTYDAATAVKNTSATSAKPPSWPGSGACG